MAALVMAGSLGVAAPASAAGYATMTVQAGAAARWDAGVYPNNLVGWVTSDGWRNPKGQSSWVKCYTDGGWATGNYSSNRWFLAYVNIGSRPNPMWLYVHSSFVTNQSGVPRC
ncbi:hypothetical protein [Microbacterium sp. VKM Ac-2923]|uniref:hypothetical protein n=1 Tax=Microbacterium sp. VKM Ac-2923 TaxID=2929476 RepID=UPI001FB226CB|nr:hypothetical protein [Microbacterium sp. VKM Ac-2923]MCJ1708434.1 hypothetical protein [Microbacterium sp. VKM Ac-2923]